jgi:peptidoglycan/xylan/chitin deacetylase (PgdA/CDA1 family)
MNESTKFNDSTVITPLVDNMQAWLNKANQSIKTGESSVRDGTDQIAVIFSSDDGNALDITNLKPIFEAQGVPLSLAIIADTYRGVTASELRDVQDNLGWEVTCHSWAHDNLEDLYDGSGEQAVADNLEACLAQYASDGLNVSTIYYPFGAYNDGVKEVASRYFRAGFTVGVGDATDVVAPPLEQFRIRRYPLDDKTLIQAKAEIDVLVSAGNGILAMYMHSSSLSMSLGDLNDLITYVKSLNIPMLNTSDALDRLGNLINIGNYDATQSDPDPHFVVGADGSIRSTSILQSSTVNLGRNPTGFEATNDVTTWKDAAISYQTYSVSEATAVGITLGQGTLITNRMARWGSTGIGMHFQDYQQNALTSRYRRIWNGVGDWSAWSQVDA